MKKSKGFALFTSAAILGSALLSLPLPLRAETAKLKIVTTNFPSYDFARQVAGDKAEVKMLLKPGAESHTYEPSADDIKSIQNSDLFFSVGGENEDWVDRVVKNSLSDKVHHLRMIDLTDTVEEEVVEGMEHEHEHEHESGEAAHEHEHEHESGEAAHEHGHGHESGEAAHEHGHGHESGEAAHEHEHEHESGEAAHEHGHEHESGEAAHEHEHGHESGEAAHEHGHEHEHGEVDEHVWTSPAKAMQIVGKVADELGKIDPDDKDTFDQNARAYIAKIKSLDERFAEIVKQGKRKTIVFGDRFPLRYFAEEFGLKYYAAFTGCSTQTEASAKTLAFLVDKVKEEKIPVVFRIELSKGKIAEAISESSGAEVLEFNSCHNVSQKQFEAGESYVSLMEKNLEPLRKALN